MANTIGKRPTVAVGHVRLPVKNVLTTSAFLQELGLRKIVDKDTFAILELRGGTHLILEKSRMRTISCSAFSISTKRVGLTAGSC